MRFASPDIVQDTVLNAPVAVADVPADTELRPALRALVTLHRLRAPVTGAHLVHKKLVVWEGRPCAVPDCCELRINGVPWVLPPVEHFVPDPGGQCESVAEVIGLNPGFSAVEGYVLRPDDSGAMALGPGAWAVADRGSDLVDPTRGHRGVPQGWAYIGIPVLLDIVLDSRPGRKIKRVDELRLRRQTINALRSLGIETLEQLVRLSHREVQRLPGVGAVAEQELDAVLSTLGLFLPAVGPPR